MRVFFDDFKCDIGRPLLLYEIRDAMTLTSSLGPASWSRTDLTDVLSADPTIREEIQERRKVPLYNARLNGAVIEFHNHILKDEHLPS